jgi:hypothetical protein
VSYLVPPAKKGSPFSQLAEITPEMNDRAYSRLLETFQFILDVMACTKPPASSDGIQVSAPEKLVSCLDPGGDGWKAALRVRLLHGVARRRILDRLSSSSNTYSIDDDGIPINQEDMGATYVSNF